MQIIRSLKEGAFPQGCVVSIGNFDGVHRGHQAMLLRAAAVAKEVGLPLVVVVFEPQPREFFLGEHAPKRVLTLRDKCTQLQQLGVDCVVCLSFNQRLASMAAEEFIETVFCQSLRARHVFVGQDFRFGVQRRGDVQTLISRQATDAYIVHAMETVCERGHKVSSTQLRCALAQGDLQQAACHLGRPFSLSGRVVYGRQLARQLGVPTANIRLRRPLAVSGVYAVNVRIGTEKKTYHGVANVGTRPTVEGKRCFLEVHVFSASPLSLYGCHLEVTFCHWLRSEQKFASLEALKAQIAHDVCATNQYFESIKHESI